MNTIHNTDLNLVRVFDAVMEEQGVSRAATRLGLTQSAVSHALNKLRRQLDDELFIRGPDRMHPTPRAMELSAPFRAALHQIETAFQGPRFDPAAAETQFVIATSDYVIGTLMPPLLYRLQQVAPKMRLWLRPFNDLNLVEGLDRGTLHLVIGAFGRTPSRFVMEPLVSGPNVWIMRAGHPATEGPFDLAALARYPHLDILIAGQGAMTAGGTIDQEGLERAYVSSNPLQLDALLLEVGMTRRVGATVSHILAAPPLIASTDMIAFVPRHFADQQQGLAFREPPYASPLLQISMLSHRTMGAHPSVAWLRAEIMAVLREDAASRKPIPQLRQWLER